MPEIWGGGGSGGFTGVDNRVVQELTKGMERSTGLSGDATLMGGTKGDEQLGGEKGERVHTGYELEYKKSSGCGGGASSGAVKNKYMNLENGEGAAAMEKEGRDPRGLNDVGLINNSPITTRAAISDAAALSKFNAVDEWGKDIDVELLNEEDSR